MFQMGDEGVEGQVELAKRIVAATPEGRVEWLFVTEGEADGGTEGKDMAAFGESRLLRAGQSDRMFWEFLRAVIDFRPHVIHACTWRGKEWAKKVGVPWLYTSDEGTESSVPVDFDEADPIKAYKTLLARPVDIFLVASGQANVTRMCIDHILAGTWWPFRLLLVNNGSEDDGATADLFSQTQGALGLDHCEVVTKQENLGCPDGRQAAYSRCTSEWFFVIDNDMLVSPGWLGKLMAVALGNENVGVVSPWSEVYPAQCCGLSPRLYNDHVKAANNLYRREAVKAAEEEKSQLYMEPFRSAQGRSDTDLNYRVLEAGYGLWFNGEVIFHHLGGSLFRMAGMTRRFGNGEAMKTAEDALRIKWASPGVRRPGAMPNVEEAMRRKPKPGQRTLCVVAGEGSPSGGAKAIRKLCEYLQAQGWFVEIALSVGQHAENWAEFSITHHGRVRDHYDVVLATFVATRPLARAIDCRLRMGLIQSDEPAWAEGQPWGRAWEAEFRLDGFREVVIADHMQEFATKYNMSIAGQTMPGVDRYVFNPKEDFAWERGEKPPRILVVTKGAHVWYDGHDYLVPALKELAVLYPDLVVDWLGIPPPDLACTVNHHETFDEHEVARLYSDATVYVLASLIEGSPLTVREAMACGTAVVSTPTGVADYATDGENIRLVPHRDSAAIVEAVSYLFDNPRDRERIALNALKLMKDHTWENYARRFTEILERELANHE